MTEEDIHWTYNAQTNCVAVIVKHVSGNMVSRWTDIFTTDGEKPDRNREEEFVDTIRSKEEMIALWEKGWNTLFNTIGQLTEEDLLKEIYIRGESHTVIDAIERQVAHYAYHIGQIVFIGKQIKGKEWKSLTIPKGKSEEYLKEMLEKHRGN
ncbi:hypothetical protein GCM10010978_04700 [Compostibacillus humi]|uniref:DUF1572 domain-containing protein n=1 Tax=Compostibacillus humi TaxID=1245525 RepID=A0A8J2ZPN4_9BACI|nr:DUF1572 family protein [Compostibacillus humi]GGH70111.1 hypothetical protein GCM10010978_04700 [Compostibacillus humi]